MENKTILTIILVAILFIYVMFFTYIMIKYVVPNKSNKSEENRKQENNSDSNSFLSASYQTDFFKKSSEHAEKILFGKIFDPQYGQSGYYGNKLIDTINKLNDDTKKMIVIAMRYFSIEPSAARNNEQLFRMMSEQEKVPLWFIVLREATKKVIPEFVQSDSGENNNLNTENKIIPLFQKTG